MWWRSTNIWTDRTNTPALAGAPVAPRRWPRSAVPAAQHPPVQLSRLPPGLRKVFRVHRARTGASRVRPHRLRHTFGTELAAAGIDLLVLRDLMGHTHVETTAADVHLAPEMAAAEWARAKQATR